MESQTAITPCPTSIAIYKDAICPRLLAVKQTDESVLMRHQVLILNRGRKRAPNPRSSDRIIGGLCTVLLDDFSLKRFGNHLTRCRCGGYGRSNRVYIDPSGVDPRPDQLSFSPVPPLSLLLDQASKRQIA